MADAGTEALQAPAHDRATPRPGPPTDDGLPTPRRYWAMLAIALGITMAVLDSSIANVALPSITRSLGATPATGVWIVNAYQLAVLVSLLPLARLGERVGYARVYAGGLVAFTLGSAACAAAPSLGVLILARVVQGLGGAGIMGVNGALVRNIYPQARLGQGVALNAVVVSLAGALGPSLASALLALGPWPLLFAVNVPLGLANLGLALRVLPSTGRSAEPFDALSASLSVLAFGLAFVGLDGLGHLRGSALLGPAAAGLAAAGAATLLVRRESRRPAPMIPLDLLRIPIFRLSVGASVCAFAAYMAAFVCLPFFLEASGRSQVDTGLLMTPWPLFVGLTAPLAGRLADRAHAGLTGAVGMVLLAASLALLATLKGPVTGWQFGWRMALGGIGFGLFQSPNNRTMLSAAPRARAGAAGGMLATARLTGMTLGASGAALALHLPAPAAKTLCLAVGTGLALLAAGASLARRPPVSTRPA